MTDHKVVGTLFIVAALAFLAVGAFAGALAKDEIGGPAELVSDLTYRDLFNVPGITLVLMVALPLWMGLASAVVPLQIGATRMAFPRVHALALWTFLSGGAMLAIAPRMDGPVRGMNLGAVLPDSAAFRGDGPVLAILGLGLILAAAVMVAVNLAVTVLALRTTGLTLGRLPLFSYASLVSALVTLLAVPLMMAALVLLLVDGHYGGRTLTGFTGSRGGNPLLWPRLFWFGAYPFLWSLLLPALGAISDIVPTFALRRLFSHARALAAVTAVGVLAFFGWGSQVTNLPRARTFFALAVLVGLLPVASLVLNWLATLAKARRGSVAGVEADKAPAVPLLGALVTTLLVLVGLGLGAAAALNSAGDNVSYWWSAQQHVLFVGAPLTAAVAALHFWAPKLWGHKLSTGTGRLSIGALGLGSLVAFLPLFAIGAQDIGLEIDDFSPATGWETANNIASIGTLIIGLGILLVVVDLAVNALAGKGEAATDNHWGGFTLEWATSSPPPPLNFTTLPDVRSEAPLLDLALAATGGDTDPGPADPEPSEPVAVGG